MKTIDLALLGFGNVGKAFARLLAAKKQELMDDHGFLPRITAITTKKHGVCIDPDGLIDQELINLLDSNKPMDLSVFDRVGFEGDTFDFIHQVPAHVLVETTPVNPHSGLPALDYLRAGARRGLHLITANKGPVVHGYRELTELTRQHDRLFRFESAVMDGAPIFSLFRGPLAGAQLHGFYGILNSCTNLLLERMRNGETLEEAIEFGASIGITETDPSNDVDGWDASIKVAALSTELMDHPLTPVEVDREGIRGITREMIAEAEAAGERWKLVCKAYWQDGDFVARVQPERVGPGSPLYSVGGTSSFVNFELDVLPGLGVLESNPSPKTTAFGMLADLIDLVAEQA